MRILQMGGNAADAAVAMAAALNVTEPTSTGIGGDVFALFWDAAAKEMKCVVTMPGLSTPGGYRGGCRQCHADPRADPRDVAQACMPCADC